MTQYIDKQVATSKIQDLMEIYKNLPTRSLYEDGLKEGRLIGYTDALNKIESITPKETKESWNDRLENEEPVSEDLEEAAEEWDESLYRSDAFKAGAQWQKNQILNNAVEAKILSKDDATIKLSPFDRKLLREYKDTVKVLLIKENRT